MGKHLNLTCFGQFFAARGTFLFEFVPRVKKSVATTVFYNTLSLIYRLLTLKINNRVTKRQMKNSIKPCIITALKKREVATFVLLSQFVKVI